MKKQTLQTVFWILVGIFIIIVSYFAIPFAHEIKRALFPYMAVIAFVLFLSGGLLTYYTIKLKIKGKLKLSLILTGGAPVVAFISVLLHNFVYGLFIGNLYSSLQELHSHASLCWSIFLPLSLIQYRNAPWSCCALSHNGVRCER